MKKTIFTFLGTMIILCLFVNQIFAQVPQYLNYQAVARNSAGTLLQNQNISLRLSIHQGSAGGTVVYSERQTTTTNQFGLFTLKIGQGTILSGTFSGIDWSTGNYWLQSELDIYAGTAYTDMGTSQLLSVPYALYAGTSDQSSYTAGTGIDITGHVISNTAPNQNQTLSLTGNTLSISNGNSVTLSNLTQSGEKYYQQVIQYYSTTSSSWSPTFKSVTSNITGDTMVIAYQNNSYCDVREFIRDSLTGMFFLGPSISLAVGANYGNSSIVLTGGYIYLAGYSSSTFRVDRYKADCLGTDQLMTIVGATPSSSGYKAMFTNGSNLYIYNNGTAWQKYQINGTTLNDMGAMTFGTVSSSTNAFYDGNFVFISNGSSIDKRDINANLISSMNNSINGYFGTTSSNYGLSNINSSIFYIVSGSSVNNGTYTGNIILTPRSKP